MAEKNLVEEAVIQLKNLEEAINENAKEILESTMKQEISELVKESLNEADEDEMEFEDSEEESEEEMGLEDESEEEESDEEESEEMDFDDEMSDDSEEMDFEFDDEENPEVMDFTNMEDTPETHDLLMTVFKKMKPEDEVEITKDGDYVNLKDGDEEYLLSVNESSGEEYFTDEEDEDKDLESELEETIYEIAMDDDNEEEEKEELEEEDSELEETIYEIHMDRDEEEFEEEFEEEDFFPTDRKEDMEEEYQEEEYMSESKKGMKPVVGKKGKTGSPKFSYEKSTGGFKTVKKSANPTKGTGKPKFEYKESTPKMKKGEFKEAARTLGNGSNFRKGGLPKPKAHSSANINMKENYELMEEVEMLRAKNEEYRKALNLFRDKLNEVAVFNSNLAYTTRLFTEHSTSKQEKINILRRFDGADTLKESKNLYKVIKDELSSTNKGNITESFERVIDNAPVTGSAQSLIESKTYENPQFMRMKDLMTKIIK